MITSLANAGQKNVQTVRIGGTPPTLNGAAKIGLIHDTVEYFESHSGADYEPLALGLVTALGVFIGNQLWIPIPAPEKQFTKLFGLIVGPSSSGKEQVIRWPLELLQHLNQDWVRDRTLWGVSSGEGLVEAIQTIDDNEDKWGSEGQALIALGEIGQMMVQLRREGSTTGTIMCRAWDDDGRIQVPTRQKPVDLAQSHIGLIGLTTLEQYKKYFDDTVWENGFGNRFLIAVNSGTKKPSSYSSVLNGLEFNQLLASWQRTLQPTSHGAIRMSANGQAYWDNNIDGLWQLEREGGDKSGRTRAKVLRLAMIYALADGAQAIGEVHLRAGVAWVDYHTDVVDYLDSAGTDESDILRQYFEDHPNAQLTRTAISQEVFKHHVKASLIVKAIHTCEKNGVITSATVYRKGRGSTMRPVTVYEKGGA